MLVKREPHQLRCTNNDSRARYRFSKSVSKMYIKKFFGFLGFIMLACLISINHCYAINEKETSLEIASSENSIELAFLSILEAEREGGDISSLVADLNQALDYLDDGKKAMKSGGFEDAAVFLNKASYDSEQIIIKALDLKRYAESRSEVSFRNQLIFSSVAAVIIIILGLLGWNYFQSYYLRRVLQSNPEVSREQDNKYQA